jgi:hypothetical protein
VELNLYVSGITADFGAGDKLAAQPGHSLVADGAPPVAKYAGI